MNQEGAEDRPDRGKRNGRILLVDDDERARDGIRVALESNPHLVVRTCTSGAEALVAAVEWLPDLVLLDVGMPHIDGLATLAMLHKDPRTYSIPVVLLTEASNASRAEQLCSVGYVGILEKPVDPTALVGAVNDLIR